MVICTRRTVAAIKYIQVIDIKEWLESQSALDFLDLADHNGTLYEQYKKLYYQPNNYRSYWIKAVVKVPLDDCLVLFEKVTGEADSVFIHEIMKDRKPDWIGQNIFLEYTCSLRKRQEYLEFGESSIRLLKLATLCGFKKWGESTGQNWVIFQDIYPSVLKGLYRNRKKYPLLLKELLDLFCVYGTDTKLFSDVPNAQYLDFVLDVAKQTRFDFSHYSFENIISIYLCQGRSNLAIKLLSYGFTLKVKSYKEFFFELHNNLLRKFHRISELYKQDCKEMFRMLFLSHPFPLVSASTLQDMVLTDVNKVNSQRGEYRRYSPMELLNLRQRKENLWKWLIHAYETCGILPPDYRDQEPRKLSHLCRCSIRKRLRDNFQLPYGIDALKNIPTDFKKFLKLSY